MFFSLQPVTAGSSESNSSYFLFTLSRITSLLNYHFDISSRDAAAPIMQWNHKLKQTPTMKRSCIQNHQMNQCFIHKRLSLKISCRFLTFMTDKKVQFSFLYHDHKSDKTMKTIRCSQYQTWKKLGIILTPSRFKDRRYMQYGLCSKF